MNNIQSPRTDDAGIEQLIVAKGKTAARVTPADINDNILWDYYFTAEQGVYGSGNLVRDKQLSLLTFCVIVLRNGFTVTGESACASPENFDPEIGKKIARENAVQKIWPLMGYELKSRLAEADRKLRECLDSKGDDLATIVLTQCELSEALRAWENSGRSAADGVGYLFDVLSKK